MKKVFLYIFTAAALTGLTTSCDDFGDVNNNPEYLNPGNMDYGLMFTHVQSQIAGSDWDIWRNGLIYSANMVQHTTSADWSQGVFYTWSDGYNSAYWDGFYGGGRGAIRNVIEVISKWENNPSYANEVQYARVMKAYMFQRMTDLYGDVPYFEAGKASITGYPKYDSQASIYDDLLKELDEVNTALKNPSSQNTIGAKDVMFGGNPEKWRKFANSLMLRVAMRLTKVDSAKAGTWAAKALSNGVIENLDDNAMLLHADGVVTNDSAEPFGKILSHEDPAKFYLSEFFVNELKSTSDPRIHLIATRCATNPQASWLSSFDFGNSDDIDQLVGMPIGYRDAAGEWNIVNAPGYPGKEWRKYYALPNRKTFSRPDVPSMLVTHTETALLLAEAAHRGYIAGGDATAKSYLEKGIKAAMQQFSLYIAARNEYNTYLSDAKVTAYVNSRLAAFSANPLKEINWQYYVTTFGDEYETFANWRRSGYPEIKSVYAAPHNRPAYPNRISTEIPRRFTYPVNESQDNTTNYNEAVKRLSDGDKMTSTVWWDKK